MKKKEERAVRSAWKENREGEFIKRSVADSGVRIKEDSDRWGAVRLKRGTRVAEKERTDADRQIADLFAESAPHGIPPCVWKIHFTISCDSCFFLIVYKYSMIVFS